jgi:hypothetical protein
MNMPALIMWAIVFCIGVPSAWRNPTAAALVLAKIAGWAWHRITGDSLPTEFYPFADIFVMAIIMSKRDCSPADKAVLLLFALCWVLYIAPIHDYYRWWALYGVTIIQFLCASAESLEIFWRTRQSKKYSPIIDLHLMVAVLFPDRAAERALLITANGGGGDG